MRVIGADGGQLGVLDTSEALRIAEEGGLDLVEVSPKAMPPVCKIMDYGKFKYEDSKKRKDAKKHQSTVTYKEIKFRPKTDEHDLRLQGRSTSVASSSEGNKARLVVIFRGREIVHPETGQAMLKKVVELTSDIAMVEQPPMMEGRRMLMIIAPRGGVIDRPPGAPGASPGTGTARHAVAVRAVAVRAVAVRSVGIRSVTGAERSAASGGAVVGRRSAGAAAGSGQARSQAGADGVGQASRKVTAN